jgi:hypothetical protein
MKIKSIYIYLDLVAGRTKKTTVHLQAVFRCSLWVARKEKRSVA